MNAPSASETPPRDDDDGDSAYAYDFGVTSAVYSLFGYASEEANGGSSGGGANLKLEKESKLLLDEKHIEHTLLKNHGVIKKTLPEVSPTDFEKYLKAIRTSYARFVATRAMAKKKSSGEGGGTVSKSSSGSALIDSGGNAADNFEEQMHRQNQLLSSVPSIFFQEEFDLTSREAFEEILPCLVSDLTESNYNNDDG